MIISALNRSITRCVRIESTFLGPQHSDGLVCNICLFSPLSLHIREDVFFSPSQYAAVSTWDYADSGLNLFIPFCKCTA